MTTVKLSTSIALLSLLGLTACFQGDHATTTDAANDAAGTGDKDLAREVAGVWLLSTDYNYDQRCNYLPVEYIRTLFKLNESVELAKSDLPNGCEVSWDGQKVGFYFQESSPFESTFQSEYVFDKFFQPQRVPQRDSAAQLVGEQVQTAGLKGSTYHGPQSQGTGAERPAEGVPAGGEGGMDASANNDSSNQPTPNETSAATRLVEPAVNTATGIAVTGVGDKAIWEPGKKTLHVLHLNHILHVRAQMKGDDKKLREGSIALAKVIVGRLFDTDD
ncbi:hypothetical protein [Spirosoma utsteinense]|uniref:Lipocalin-like domain-containing protein n=1 Tax=Spirosoma utsteinense TaxID=2585773 RepID=A0ABR6WE24_9BACT|nr:hypothetical protein [Spirosoma utsteinense]MBC3787491.1 hypothetical protein [Spirosoma utsteinense]MBC3794428.1 hypothetical protein [Spirosoma utsteinense]